MACQTYSLYLLTHAVLISQIKAKWNINTFRVNKHLISYFQIFPGSLLLNIFRCARNIIWKHARRLIFSSIINVWIITWSQFRKCISVFSVDLRYVVTFLTTYILMIFPKPLIHKHLYIGSWFHFIIFYLSLYSIKD